MKTKTALKLANMKPRDYRIIKDVFLIILIVYLICLISIREYEVRTYERWTPVLVELTETQSRSIDNQTFIIQHQKHRIDYIYDNFLSMEKGDNAK